MRAVLNILVAAISLAATLFVCDLVIARSRPDLTLSSNERVAFCAYDPELGWRNRPNTSGTFFGTRVVHNGEGQRDKPRRPGRSGSGPRVMVLGDSFVWGYRVEAHQRFTDRLEARIPGSEVLNFGCSGYGQDQEYLLLQREIRRWQPDTVVTAVHVSSDVYNNTSSLQYGYYKPLFRVEKDELVLHNVPVPKNSAGSRIDTWMTPRSALWNLVGNQRTGETTVRMRIVDTLNALSSAPTPRTLRSNVAPHEITCRLCDAIRNTAEASGAEALFLLIPNVEARGQAIVSSAEYARLRACLRGRNLRFLDLEPVFRRDREQNPRRSITLGRDRHWSAHGNAVVSRALHNHFRRRPPKRAQGDSPPAR